VIGPGSLIQGTIPADRRLRSLVRVRRLEAVVLTPDGRSLVHYYRDQTRPDRPWVRGEVITEYAAGPGTIVQVPDGFRGAGELHVLVPELSSDAVAEAPGHYVRPARGGRWRPARPADGRGLARFVGGDPRRLGARTVVEAAEAELRRLLERRGGRAAAVVAVAVAPTRLAGVPGVGEVLAALPGGDRGLALPATASGGHGWLQALVQEGTSVYQWHRQMWRGRTRWVRAACLRFDPGDGFTVDAEPSVKLAQVTGERDSQPSRTDATLSFSESRSGVRGTDLGVRVDHAGRTFLLFGDSHWTRPGRVTRDAIGVVTPRGSVPGLPGVELHGAPLRIVGGPATSREYDVPLDAFSLDAAQAGPQSRDARAEDGPAGEFFAFFSSHHFARHQVMGRSLLTRAVDPSLPVCGGERRRPIDFRLLGTFSDRYFVNVSVARRGETLYVWGSGSYRADDLRLARIDLGDPAVRDALLGGKHWSRPLGGLTYWAGQHPDDTPRWSPDEDDAAPVLPGAFGELSVRWLPEAGRYLLLAMDGPEDPIGPGVTLRTASEPWGPWTPRRRLFDWIARGMAHHDEASRFIRAYHAGDPVGDAIFPLQRAMTGAAYAPYLFDARAAGDTLVLRYTLSTWNPYQVVLMEHRLPIAAL